MKKILSFSLAFVLCFSFLSINHIKASAASYDTFWAYENGKEILNVLVDNISQIKNGVEITTWYGALPDSNVDDTYLFRYSSLSSDYGALYLKGSTSYVVSYNRLSGKPVAWVRDSDNPLNEYAISNAAAPGLNTKIYFTLYTGQPCISLTNTGIYINGIERGRRLTTTPLANNTGAIWNVRMYLTSYPRGNIRIN